VTPIHADYFDGKSATRRVATIMVAGEMVTVSWAEGAAEFPLRLTRVMPQLRGTPRRIEFPDGSAAIARDHAAVEAAFQVASARTLANRLESHLGFVFSALLGVIGAVVLGYLYGVPWVAREIAQRLPLEIESQIAEAGMKSLDQTVFAPTRLDADTRAKISAVFSELRAATHLPSTVRLEFRDGGWIGANAFALPGGVVVITDQLIEVLPVVDEAAAVLAHELGHVENRHSLRHVLQASIAALAAAAIYGDVASLTGIAVTAPTVLAHNGYSRDFEREADSFAFALLKETGRSPILFARAMRALETTLQEKRKENRLRKKLGLPEAEKAPPEERDASRHREFDYLSTHPPTEERIRAAEDAERTP
jgi:Zn-dependent protease with chaperone function